MRGIITIAALLSLLLTGCGGGSAKRSAAEQSTLNAIMLTKSITLDDDTLQSIVADTLQLGRMQSGEVLKQRVRLINNSSEPIVLNYHHTSCGCTDALYERKPIAVGEYADVVVSYDSQGEWGWRMQLLELYLARKDYPIKIYIDAEVY